MGEGDARDQLNIFISYSREDGTPHAKHFAEVLARSARYSVSYDYLFDRSEGWDRSVEAAISTADVMIILLTDSLFGKRWARNEILYARHLNRMKNRIRLIVAQLSESPDVPYSIIELTRLNFAKEARAAWAELNAELDRASSPENGARPLEAPTGDHRDLRYETAAREAAERARAERRRADDLVGAEERLRQRVEAELRRDTTAEASVRPEADILFVNEMPELPETEFQDRVDKMVELDAALHRPETRLVLITGDGGTGKTAFLHEYRSRLAAGELTASAAGFVYLAVRGYRQVSAATLLNDVALVAPDAGELQRRLRSRSSWRDRLDAVLTALADTPVIVAIDDAEDLMSKDDEIRERDLRLVITELIRRPDHRIRVLMVVKRRRQHSIREAHRTHVEICDLARGLPANQTTPVLKALDAARLLSIPDIPETDLRQLAVISDGNPRFLELTYSLLRSDPELTLAGMFDELDLRHEEVTEEAFARLVDAVLARLARTDRRVIQALAIYGHPVRPEAVDYLLQEYVRGIDSAPALDTLATRRLVRRDGDRYFLPPSPDSVHVLASVPTGDPDDWRVVQPLFTQPFLRRRAADFYAEVSRDLSVRGPHDLQPQLKEIELRIAAGDYELAVELMETIDEEYLTSWGQSGVLNRWREQVDDQAEEGTRWRAANLSFLISARSGEEDYSGRWTDRLRQVVAEPWTRSAPADRTRFGIQLADLYADNGYLATAAELYAENAARCRSKSMRYELVMARASRGLCLARLGSFDDSRRELELARKWLPGVDEKRRPEALSLLLLNEGWMLGQLGEGAATTVLDEGLSIARDQDKLLTGKTLASLAALYCDSERVDLAIDPAIEAAQIAMRTGHQGLTRDANVTLALVHLLDGAQKDAAAAIKAASQQPPGILALDTHAIEGVIHFLDGNPAKARAAFHAACTEAWLRLERAPQEYAVYDLAGLALTGLELCGEAHRLPRAVDMYRAARRIASVRGARRRAKAQLNLLAPAADRSILAVAQRAADGDDAGARQLIA